MSPIIIKMSYSVRSPELAPSPSGLGPSDQSQDTLGQLLLTHSLVPFLNQLSSLPPATLLCFYPLTPTLPRFSTSCAEI